MKLRILTLLSVVFLLPLGCTNSGGSSDDGGGGGGGGSLSTNACGAIGLPTRVINGSVCGNLAASSVVRVITINNDGSAGSCSGTMIAPNAVVTAAHCFFPTSDSIFPVAAGVAYGDLGSIQTVQGVDFQFPAGVRVEETNGETNVFNDIAIVRLSSAIPVPTSPILVSTSPVAGDTVQVFGYGLATEQDDEAEADGELRSGEMSVQSVSNNHIRAVRQRSGSGTCFGDSGGPMMFRVNGQTAIVGVTSQFVVPSDCSVGDISQWTRLQSSELIDWIINLVPDASFI